MPMLRQRIRRTCGSSSWPNARVRAINMGKLSGPVARTAAGGRPVERWGGGPVLARPRGCQGTARPLWQGRAERAGLPGRPRRLYSQPLSPPSINSSGVSMTTSFDVVGIGNAIVDVFSQADDSFLDRNGLVKGAMTLIDEARAEELYARMGTGVEEIGRAHV